jgi:hypothetical protein
MATPVADDVWRNYWQARQPAIAVFILRARVRHRPALPKALGGSLQGKLADSPRDSFRNLGTTWLPLCCHRQLATPGIGVDNVHRACSPAEHDLKCDLYATLPSQYYPGLAAPRAMARIAASQLPLTFTEIRMKTSARKLGLALLALLACSGLASATGEGVGDATDGQDADATAENTDFDALRRKAANEDAWKLESSQQVKINKDVLNRPWQKPPFDTTPFTYTPEALREKWPTLMQGFGVPYMSAEMLRQWYERYPELRDSHPGFDGDFATLEVELMAVLSLFVRGEFQEARRLAPARGPLAVMWAASGQVYQATYLEPNLTAKHMLLQDVINTLASYRAVFQKMKKSREPIDRDLYVLTRLTYIYAVGRIAEDVAIPVAIRRNYIFKVMGAVDDVRTLTPGNPLGIAAEAGVDANVVRKVGKAAGRVTFGARQASVRENFERALSATNLAIIRYEYANAILYINKRRGIDEAIEQLARASRTPPRMAIEALDAMYASKRLREIRSLAKSTKSFRSYERQRSQMQQQQDVNLYCVLPDICKPVLVDVP